MTKFYCDRCNTEVKSENDLCIVDIPNEITRYGYNVRKLAVCRNCENEHTKIITFLTQVRFAAFKSFMGDLYVSEKN